MFFGLRGILFRLGHINSRSIWLCGQKVLRKPIEKETVGAKTVKKRRFWFKILAYKSFFCHEAKNVTIDV